MRLVLRTSPTGTEATYVAVRVFCLSCDGGVLVPVNVGNSTVRSATAVFDCTECGRQFSFFASLEPMAAERTEAARRQGRSRERRRLPAVTG